MNLSLGEFRPLELQSCLYSGGNLSLFDNVITGHCLWSLHGSVTVLGTLAPLQKVQLWTLKPPIDPFLSARTQFPSWYGGNASDSSQGPCELYPTLYKVLEEPTTHTGGHQMVARGLRSKCQDRAYGIFSLWGNTEKGPLALPAHTFQYLIELWFF